MKKLIFITLGSLTFTLGTIGVFIPILPTTPFYLATAFFWINSSSKLHAYLLKNKYYQTYVQEMIVEKKMSKPNQKRMLIIVFFVLAIPFVLVNNLYMRIALCLVFLGHLIFLPLYFRKKPHYQSSQLKEKVINDR